MPCHRPAYDARPHSRSLLRKYHCEASLRARFVSRKTRAGCVGFVARTYSVPRLGPSGASTFPRIWIRSIDACKISVKRKTQNVDGLFRTVSISSGALSLRTIFAFSNFFFPPLALNSLHPISYETFLLTRAIFPRSPRRPSHFHNLS